MRRTVMTLRRGTDNALPDGKKSILADRAFLAVSPRDELFSCSLDDASCIRVRI